MASVAGSEPEVGSCDGCLKPSRDLNPSAGYRICDKCKAVFLTAAVLLNEGITAEDTLIPTLVFAKIAGGTPEYTALVRQNASISGLEIVELIQAAVNWPPRHSETSAEYAKTLTNYVQEHGYGGWRLVRVVRGVPILRVQPLVALPETHPGTEILKSVRVQVLSRHVKPSKVEKTYERLLVDNGVRWGANNSGHISYQFHDGFLQVEAGLEGTISPLMAKSVGANTLYSWPACNFPPPSLVTDIYESLLGSVHKKTGRGFAYDLDLYGKPYRERSAKKIVVAFAAWHIGEGPRARIPPKTRPRVARILNKQLLDPEEWLPENTWSPEDKMWRDVEELARRFVRLYAGGPGAYFTGS
jgi:hypothetical protein